MKNQSPRLSNQSWEWPTPSPLEVGDLMTTDVLAALETDHLKTIREVMYRKGIRHVPVIRADGVLVGLVSRSDLLRYSISAFADVSTEERDSIDELIPAKKMMQTQIATAYPEMSLRTAAAMMVKLKYGCLPVVNRLGKLVGIITEADFVKFFATPAHQSTGLSAAMPVSMRSEL